MINDYNQDDLAKLFAIKKIKGVGDVGANRLLSHFKTPSSVFNATPSQLANAGLKRESINSILSMDFNQFDSVFEWLEEQEHQVLAIDSPYYPSQLKQTATPPLFLFAIGNLERLSDPQLAVVGSRSPTPQGILNTQNFCQDLIEQGFTITSGMALGIDGEAHKAALSFGGYTLAVMGTGLSRVYPPRHRELAHQVAEKGLLISEFFPDQGVTAGCFPRRNRVIAGLSMGTLVIEAAPKSGSLITAKIALEESREVFAIPGAISNPLAQGCHSLIRQGATLVEKWQDIMDELPSYARPKVTQQDIESRRPLTNEAEVILKNIDYQTTSLESILQRTEIPIETITNILLLLELDGWVINQAGGYSRI